MEKIHFSIKGITCQACVKLVSRLIGRLDGVRDVKVELDGSSLVTADRIIGEDEIRNVLIGSNFDLI